MDYASMNVKALRAACKTARISYGSLDTAGMRALAAVNGKEVLHLGQHRVEIPRLVAVIGFDGIAMHGVAAPHHHTAFGLDAADELGHMLCTLACSNAADKGDASGFIAGVEDVEQLD